MKSTSRKTAFGLLSILLVLFLFPQNLLHAAPADGTALFADDFTTENSDWITSGGSWSVQDGQLLADGMPTAGEPQPEPKYRWVDGLGTDVIVTADITPQDISNPDHRIGIASHVKGGAGDTKWNLIFHDGKLALLEEGIAWRKDTPFAYEAGKTYKFKMSVAAGTVSGKAWLAGTPEPENWMVSDTFAGQREEDGVGLYAGNGKAAFDNFAVLPAPSFEVRGSEPGNVFTFGQTAEFHYRLAVKSAVAQTFEIAAVIKDLKGHPVFENTTQAAASDGQPFEGSVAASGLAKGYYTADFRVTQGADNEHAVHTTLAVVDQLPAAAGADSPFGIGSDGAFLGDRFDEHEADQRYAILEKLGVKWVREELFWDSLRPDPNQPYKWERFDYSVERARDHGLNIMGIIDYFSSWSMPYGDGKNTDMDAAIRNFAQYASDVVNYYKPNGTLAQQKGWQDGYGVTAWEIWNEPPTFWFGTAEQFGQLVKAAAAAIRQADPNAAIIVTNAGEDFDQTVYNIAGAESYNSLAIHLYPGPMGPEPGNFAAQARQTRAFLDRNGLNGAGIWVTEFGWDTFQVSETEQAAYLVRANTELLSAGTERNFAFTFNYGSEPPGWSVVHPDLTPKPSFAAYAEMTRRLTGLKPVRELPMGTAVRGHLFSNGSTHTAIVWSVEETGALQIDLPGVQAFDMMGNPVGESAGGSFAVPLTGEPVYLVSTQGTADELGNAVQNGRISGIAPLGIRIQQPKEMPTQLPPLQLTVENRTNETQSGFVTVQLPAGWSADTNSLPFGPLQPGQQQQLTLALTQVVTNPDNRYPIRASATAADGTPVKAETVLQALASVNGTPVVDGDLGDWTGALGVRVDRPEQIVGIPNWTPDDMSAELYTMWDDDNLYFGAVVNDDAHVQNGTDFWIWASDSIQLYFDTLNDKANGPAADDQDLGLAYNPSAGPQVYRWTGGSYQGIVPSVKLAAKFDAQGRLIYEAAIPLAELQMSVTDGKTFGFDALINDDDGAGREGWGWWTPGVGNAWDPSQWDTWTAIRSMELASVRMAPNAGEAHDLTVQLSSPKLKLAVSNQGVSHLKLTINGKTLNLIANGSFGQQQDGKNGTQFIRLDGDTILDLSAYAVAGSNVIRLDVSGGANEARDAGDAAYALIRFLAE